jgi:hypothetical protein
VAATRFTPWVLAVSHLMFGLITATFAAIAVPDAVDASARMVARPETTDPREASRGRSSQGR